MDRKAGLDVVRTAAISFVLLRHWWVAIEGYGPTSSILGNIAANGWLGVDIFFALSGFLVSRSFWTKNDAREFLVHRIARIVPAYFFCLLVIFAAPGVFMGDPAGASALEIVEHLFFLNDYTGSELIVAFWTLAVEMKFYVVAAGVFVILRGRKPTTIALVLAGLAFASIAARALEAAMLGDGIDYLLYFHNLRSPMHVSLDPLFLGASAGVLTLARTPSQSLSTAMVWAGTLGLFTLLASKQWMVVPGVMEVAAVPGAAGIFAALLVAGAAQSRSMPASRGFKRAAELTFAVYLVHMSTIPWATGVMEFFQGSELAFTLFYLCATLMLAAILHAVIEQPARRYLLNRFSTSPQRMAAGS
jgi:peptidoglycan/LPS O-acetylase OafA/YrhL